MNDQDRKICLEMAVEQLLLAYAKGATCDGHIQWDDLDIAFDYAQEAMPGRYDSIMAEITRPDE